MLTSGMAEFTGGTRKQEYIRTAELLVTIAKEQGTYFALAFLLDSGYTRDDLLTILPILQETPGAILKQDV